jgi:hypothetical protein
LRLEAVVLLAEGVLVVVAGLFSGEFGVVYVQAGGVSVFHRNHGVVRSGEGLFSADGVDPRVDGLLVIAEELVEVDVFHLRRR